jgi:hypothetical protein
MEVRILAGALESALETCESEEMLASEVLVRK